VRSGVGGSGPGVGGSGPGVGRVRLREQLPYRVGEELGVVEVGGVTRARHLPDRRVRDLGPERRRVASDERGLLLAVEDQRRDRDRREVDRGLVERRHGADHLGELVGGHPRALPPERFDLPVVAAGPRPLDEQRPLEPLAAVEQLRAERVGEHQPREPIGVGRREHLGDTAASGVPADDRPIEPQRRHERVEVVREEVDRVRLPGRAAGSTVPPDVVGDRRVLVAEPLHLGVPPGAVEDRGVHEADDRSAPAPLVVGLDVVRPDGRRTVSIAGCGRTLLVRSDPRRCGSCRPSGSSLVDAGSRRGRRSLCGWNPQVHVSESG
jgi:hypothetical protein